MCDNFRPIRDLDVVMRENQFIRYNLPENRINNNIFYDSCNKTRINRMNENQFNYNTSIFQFQNSDRPVPQYDNSNIIDMSNELMRNPKSSCFIG